MNEDKISNEEILDSPLVVHRKEDASYKESAIPVDMDSTHIEQETETTLERHRFRKDHTEKKGKAPFIFLALVIIASIVFAFTYYDKVIVPKQDATKTTATKTTETTTSLQEAYKNTIVVKGTYIFVNAVEVNGIEGLQSSLEYEDKSTTAFTIINENANGDFLNYEVLPLLESLGFYDANTQIKHVARTGLISAEETTAVVSSTTTTVPLTNATAQQPQ